jgi:hypothetical protein
LEEELTDSEKTLLEELRKINNKTHETNYALGLISQETYEKFKGNYVGRGYEIYEKTLEDFERPIAKENKLMTKIFKQRQDIEEWHVDNAIQDPIYLTVNRMIQTERNAAVLAYSHFVAKQPGVVSTKARPGFTKLVGKAYGKLQGKYVVNYVAEDFKGYFYTNYIADRVYSAIKYYDKTQARQFVKKYHTVWSPAVQFGNLMSNNAFAFAAGLNVAQFWYQGPRALKDIRNKSGDYLVLLENGIIGTNVLTSDISLPKSKQDELQVGAYKKTKDYLKKLDKKAQEVYAGADDLSKLAAYKALKAAGYTQDQAIQRVFEGFQNYASVGKIWDFAAKTPVWGNAYIKFQADLQRIIKNAVTKRPLTTAAFLGMLRGTAIVLSNAFGEEEEERDIREGRAFIPKINLGVTDIPLVFKIGKEKELNIARFISPYYEYDIPTKSFLEKATRWAPFQYREYETAAMGEFAGSLETSDVLLGPWWAAFINNRDFRQKTITDPNANRYTPSGKTTMEKTLNRFNYIARSQVPLWNTINDAILSAKYGQDYFGREKDYLDLIISKVAKVQTFNDESLKRELMSRYRTINFEQKAINAKMTAAKNRTIKEVNAVHKRVSEGEITEARGAEIIKRRSEEGFNRWSVHFEALAKEQSKLNKLIEDTRPLMDRLQ